MLQLLFKIHVLKYFKYFNVSQYCTSPFIFLRIIPLIPQQGRVVPLDSSFKENEEAEEAFEIKVFFSLEV